MTSFNLLAKVCGKTQVPGENLEYSEAQLIIFPAKGANQMSDWWLVQTKFTFLLPAGRSLVCFETCGTPPGMKD